MFKKFITMATATLVISGLSVVAVPTAFATSSDATLDLIRLKGVSVTDFGVPNATLSNVTAGSVQVTEAQASGSGTNTYRPTNRVGMTPVAAVQKFSSGATLTFTSNNMDFVGSLVNGDRVVIKQTAEDNSTILYYVITVTVGSSTPSSSSSSSSDSAAAAAAALAAQVATAKATLVDSIKSGKPLTAADLNAADLTVASAKAAERVNAKIQTLPEAQRSDLAKIKIIVERENFVEKVSSATTQFQVNTRDLVRVGLVAPDYVFKGAVVRSLLAADPVVLATIEQVEAAVKEAQAAVQARKDRLAAIIAKINGTK